MIIKDERNLTPTHFKDLEVGDVYKHKNISATFMKITGVVMVEDDTEGLYNCVCLDDGFLDYTLENAEVFKLKTELRIFG